MTVSTSLSAAPIKDNGTPVHLDPHCPAHSQRVSGREPLENKFTDVLRIFISHNPLIPPPDLCSKSTHGLCARKPSPFKWQLPRAGLRSEGDDRTRIKEACLDGRGNPHAFNRVRKDMPDALSLVPRPRQRSPAISTSTS